MEKVDKIKGVVVPMITPFTPDGNIDTIAASRIAEHIISAGAAVFILGTTGEGPSIHPGVRDTLVDTVIQQNIGRSLIYASISDHCIEVSLEQAHRYADLGVDLVVAHVPSYYPLTDNEIAQYFLTLANNVPVPLVLYNIPITTRMSVPLNVIEQLSHHPNVAGIKDSENDLQRLNQSMMRWKNRRDFKHLTGCTVLSHAALSMGADGIVPSPGNLVPSLYCRLCDAVQNGDLEQARHLQACSDDIAEIFHKDRPLCHSLPLLKAMMHVHEFCDPCVLPPLLPVTPRQLKTIKKQLSTLEPLLNQP